MSFSEFAQKNQLLMIVIVTVIGILGLCCMCFTFAAISPSSTTSRTHTNDSQISITPVITADITETIPTATLIPSPTPTLIPTSTPVPTATPTPRPAQVRGISDTSTYQAPKTQNSGYSCDCSKTCDEMISCSEAYYQLNTCGCGRRDGDNDGIPCDAMCQ